MIILPKEQPAIQGLNTYYLDVRKLLEHYQGELGSGGVYFRSPSEEGVIFFDKDEFLNAIYESRGEESIKGEEAIDKLLTSLEESNFVLDVYAIDPQKIYFWSNIPSAEPVFRDLSTEFTDLLGLIKKMMSEKLTGYIEVSIQDGEEGGLILFINGQVIGGSYSWGQGQLNGSEEARNLLIQKTKESGGTFNVSKISPEKVTAAPEPVSNEPAGASEKVIPALQEFLEVFERIIRAGKFAKGDFSTLLKKKFVDKADTYLFLDPFAGEFSYDSGKIQYSGNAAPEELVRGVMESVKELAQELGAWPRFSEEIRPWSEKYASLLSRCGVSL